MIEKRFCMKNTLNQNIKGTVKISVMLIAFVLSAAIFAACASKPKVLSSKSSKHITVQQTNMGVYIVAHREKSEDIKTIQLTDSENGATIDLSDSTSVTFLWPFAESGKSYTLNAYLRGDRTKSKETVTFKTDSVSTTITKYNEDYLKSKLVLIASGTKRIVKLNTTKEALLSVLGATNVAYSKVTVDIFSGRHFNTDEMEATYIGTFSIPLVNAGDIKKLTDGYDIISIASAFNVTSSQLNSRLAQNPTYFARAYVSFNLADDSSAAVAYTTKYIYSNDTIYTPVGDKDLLEIESAANDAK